MNDGHRRRYVVFIFAATTVIVAFGLLYRSRPLVGVAFGSTAVALAMLAHLGVLAVLVGPVVAWRRRRRQSPSQRDRRK